MSSRQGVSAGSLSAVGVVAALAVTLLTASGCGSSVKLLKQAASADLNCPKSSVHILNSGRTRDVEACGQRATYHWEEGDWRMIARSVLVPVAAPQPVVRSAPPPGVMTAQPVQLVPSSPAGTPSQPPPSSPAPGGKSL